MIKINREAVPVELQDALLGPADSFASLPETAEIEFPTGETTRWSIADEATYLKVQMFGSDYESRPTTISTPISDAGLSCGCPCFGCSLAGDCSLCSMGCSGKAKSPVVAPIVPEVDEFEQATKGGDAALSKRAKLEALIPAGTGIGISARDALRRAQETGTLTRDQLRSLEIHVTGKSDFQVQSQNLRVARIFGNESQGFRIEFDAS